MSSAKQITFNHEGFKASLDAKTDSGIKDALAQQGELTQRYLKLEPAVSTAFGAPECYQRGTEARSALLEYLKTRHPMASKIALNRQKQETAKAAGDPEEAHKFASLARIDEEKRDSDVQNAIRYFLKYHLQGNAGSRAEKQSKSPRQLAEQLIAACDRFGKDNSQWPAADQRLAREIQAALREVLGQGKPNIVPPNTIGASSRKAGEVKTLSADEIAAIEAAAANAQ
jgi:hypothetical protein